MLDHTYIQELPGNFAAFGSSDHVAPTPRKSKNGGGTPSGGSLFTTLSLIPATHADDDDDASLPLLPATDDDEFNKL